MHHAARTEPTPKPAGRRIPRGKRDVLPGCVRSCAACRQRAPRGELLRFVLVDGRVVFDPDRLRQGRGLNLGPSPRCIERAQKKGAFQRQWRIALSPEDARVLAADVGERVRERLAHWLEDAWQRGALAPVAGPEAVEPERMRVLWTQPELASIVGRVPPSIARTPRAAARMAALTHAAWQFTLLGAGDMKRRPEPADVCPALAPVTGLGQVGQAADDASITVVGPPTTDGSGRTPLGVEAGVSSRGARAVVPNE